LALEMPIRQSSKEVQRSSAHIKWLKEIFPNVSGAEVNLTEVFATFEKTVKKSEVNENNASTEISFAHMRSWLRMFDQELSRRWNGEHRSRPNKILVCSLKNYKYTATSWRYSKSWDIVSSPSCRMRNPFHIQTEIK
jgi:hypothetical protein